MAAARSSASIRSLQGRLLVFAKPYVGWIVLAMCLTLVFASGRYVRAYLIKPLLDEVLLPAQVIAEEGQVDWLGQTRISFDSSPVEQPELETSSSRFEERIESIRENLVFIVALALGIVIAMPGVLFARLYLLEYTLGRISVDIKRALAGKLLRLPLSFHRDSRSGDTLTRALADASASEGALKIVFGDFLQAIAMMIGGAITLFLISWQLTLIALLTAPFVTGIVALYARRIRRTTLLRQEQLGEVTQRLVGILAGIKVIKAFRGESLENAAFAREADKLFRRNMKVVKNRVLSRSFVEGLNGAMGVGMLALGCILVLEGMWGMTPGDVAAFATVLATTYRPIKTLSRGWGKLSESLASAERFFAILDSETESPDAANAIRIDGVRDQIAFRHVSFGYGNGTVLDDVSLEVRAGEVIALVGRSGEGKTTLVDLLLRFHDPSAGKIEIDGVDLCAIERESLLDQIAIVSQEPFLFDTSIEENIRYGRPAANREDVLRAAHAARVDEFIDQLPEGYDTPVGEFGLRLSGGQRQRITIARALLKDPAILIFDEATSALDAKTEQSVQDAIEALRGERTLFIVAHRLSTIRRADRIAVMQNGRIAQLGRHEELIEQSGLYRELVSLQSSESL